MPVSEASDRYELVHISQCHSSQVKAYWYALSLENVLKARIFDANKPTLDDVAKMIKNKNNQSFYVRDKEADILVADAMLNNAKGLVCQVHFSVHPGYYGAEALTVVNSGLKGLFNLTDSRSDKTIQALVGVTPIKNRLAICFLRKIKFKKLDILPGIYYTEGTNKYHDAQLSILKKEEFYSG